MNELMLGTRYKHFDVSGRLGWVAGVIVLGWSAAAHAGSGCAQWFSQASWMLAHEIATKSASEPEQAARLQVMYATWDHLGKWSLDPLHAEFQDVWVGDQTGERKGHPKGAAACEALGMRKVQSGQWSSEEVSKARQKAIDDLALIDWSLANQEVERMRSQRDWQMQFNR